jgi:hypothetical protein
MNDTTHTKQVEVEKEEVSLEQRQQRLPRVTSNVTLVDPVNIRRKPGPASKTRPDIRERWGEQVPGPEPASLYGDRWEEKAGLSRRGGDAEASP